LVSENNTLYADAVLSIEEDHTHLHDGEEVKTIPEIIQFDINYPIERKGMANYELLYGGKNDVSINATYREFTPDNLAREAFYQNIVYQPDAKQIRFNNILIEVHEATNEK